MHPGFDCLVPVPSAIIILRCISALDVEMSNDQLNAWFPV